MELSPMDFIRWNLRAIAARSELDSASLVNTNGNDKLKESKAEFTWPLRSCQSAGSAYALEEFESVVGDIAAASEVCELRAATESDISPGL